MESKKIHFIVTFPNDLYDNLIIKCIEVCQKFDWIEYYILPQGEPYEKLQTLPKKELYEVLIMSNHKTGILENVLYYFPNLKWVQLIGTGVDKIINVFHISNRLDITLTNLRSSSNTLLSEFAIFGCLYFCKKSKYYLNLMDKKQWVPKDYFDISSLEGKTALIVGAGSIGTSIAKKCRFGFNMKVLGIKRDVNVEENEIFDKFYKLEEIGDLVKQSDFVFHCLPRLKLKSKIYTENIFKSMKKNTVFVNVGRGDVVDEIALCKALREDWILGAALDVFEKEPIDKNHEFYNDEKVKEKVFISCHSMDRGTQYSEIICDLLEENLIKYKQGKSLNGIIDKELGY